MRNSDPIIWPDDTVDLSIRQNMQRNYSDCINILQTQWYQADLDQRFVMGDQDLWGLLFPGVATYRRKIFNFNLINPIIQMASGLQRKNRKSTVVIPIQNSSQKTADQLTKCLFHVHNQSGLYQVYSDCFEQGALSQGLGFIQFYKDLTCGDPISGEIKGRYVDMKSCLFDPFFRRHDMMDARFWWTRQFFGRTEAAQLMPEYEDHIMNLPRGSYRDDKFYYMPEVYQIQFPDMIALDEYWYTATRQASYMVDVESEEVQEFMGDEEDMRYIYSKFRDRIKFIKKPKQTVRRSIILNDRTIVDEANPLGIDRYPVVPMLAYFTPDSPYYAYKFRGITRDLRDSQYLFNRRKVADLDILESQQQGLKIKKGALVTPDDALNTGNGRAFFINPANQMSDVEPMPIVPPAPQLLQMEEMLKAVMHQISGVSPEMMGQDIDDKAGIITMMRSAAGQMSLTRLYDQFDEAQKMAGDIIVEIIQKNWTYGKVRQVIGEEPTAEFDDKAFFKYGCKVAQASLTESQQQLELAQLLHAREVTGIAIPSSEILKRLVIQGKDELIEAVTKQEQAQQEQQQKMEQLQMQQLQVDNQTKISYSHSQEALANERTAKIQLDKALNVERLQRAEEEKTAGVLNLIKAVKELKGMDIDHLERSLQIVMSLEEGQDEQKKKPTSEVNNV